MQPRRQPFQLQRPAELRFRIADAGSATPRVSPVACWTRAIWAATSGEDSDVPPRRSSSNGPVASVVKHGPYRLEFLVSPNKAAVPNSFALRITRGGSPVRGADVTTTFTMLDMEMGQQAYNLAEISPGVYSKAVPALVMVGRWGLQFEVRPPGGQPFSVLLVDRANG